MGPGRTYRIGDILEPLLGGKPQRDGIIFMGEVDPENLCKDFNLAIGGGLGWIEWLKNGTGNGFIYHVIIPELYTLW